MDITVGWLIHVVIVLCVLGVIGWILYWVVGKAPMIPAEMKQVIQFVIILVLAIALIVLVLVPLLHMRL